MAAALSRRVKRPERAEEPLGATVRTLMAKSGYVTTDRQKQLDDLAAKQAADDRALKAARLRAACNVMPRDVVASLWSVDYPRSRLSDEHFERYQGVRDELATLLNFPGTLVLSGPNGPGKTYLAAALVMAFCDAGRPAYYCTAQGYYRELAKRFGSPAMDDWHAKLSGRDRDDGFQLLVIDEVEVQPQNAWHLNELRDLINERYGRLVATVLITNLATEDINAVQKEGSPARCFNNAILDRIRQIGTILACDWPSLRESQWPPASGGEVST